jgi:hypothetical protein
MSDISFGIVVVVLTSACIVAAQPAPWTYGNLGMTARVFKARVFPALVHDHEIAAPIAGGTDYRARPRARYGSYVETARLKQSDFGIKPVKVGGGMVGVRDKLRIESDVRLAREQSTRDLPGK